MTVISLNVFEFMHLHSKITDIHCLSYVIYHLASQELNIPH